VPTPLDMDPGTWNSATAAPYTLGGTYEVGGKVYRYVQLSSAGGAVSATNGMVAEKYAASGNIVTVDRSDSTASGLGRAACGVFVGSVTAGRYGFIQVLGEHAAVKDAANAATLLVKIKSHATVDGDAAPASAYTDIVIGYATAAASGGTFPMELTLGC